MITAVVVSLFITACINGTVHGAPKTLCHEFQIRSYPSIEACNAAHEDAVADWIDGMKLYNLALRVAGSRCGPAEHEEDEP